MSAKEIYNELEHTYASRGLDSQAFIFSIVNSKAKKEAIVMGDDKVKNNDEEEEERAGEEKTSGNWKWKEMLFGLLLFLVFFILPSWYSGDWSSGWKYRSI